MAPQSVHELRRIFERPLSLALSPASRGRGNQRAVVIKRLVFIDPLVFRAHRFTLHLVNPTEKARRLRHEQTDEEKELWRALRAGRFAGFKFRRQHPLGIYTLDFFCPAAQLSIELNRSQHGFPEQRQRDVEREWFLAVQGIEELRFWNREWRQNREGVLLAIWEALHRRSGCVQILRKVENNRFVPPAPERVILTQRLPR